MHSNLRPRLFAITMIKNGSDILASFVRTHDVFVLNGSSDFRCRSALSMFRTINHWLRNRWSFILSAESADRRRKSDLWFRTITLCIGRLGVPREVADVVVWLCTDAASFVTGHAMLVDGGWETQ